MCGIFGHVGRFDPQALGVILDNMKATLKHRGPDADGFYAYSFFSLGNTRLSVLDRSIKANQPMVTDCGNSILVQNGEIYNFLELRKELREIGIDFKTESDSEVLLHGFHAFGSKFVEKINGMFAIAYLDKRERRLRLFRDRLGVKPLFYSTGPDNNTFWYASEIKALLKTPIKTSANIDSIAAYLVLNYVPGTDTAFNGIKSVPPGSFLEIGLDIKPTIHTYWNLEEKTGDTIVNLDRFYEEFGSVFDDATSIRTRSDVPIGAFLSGGLDSSSVVATLKSQKNDEIKTYSIGFTDPKFDETPFAIMASKRFNTVHKTQFMEETTYEQWKIFIQAVEQPHGDISFIPTGLVSKLASSDITVAFTGDGADELFGGYSKVTDFFKNYETTQIGDDWSRTYAERIGVFSLETLRSAANKSLLGSIRNVDPYQRFLSFFPSKASHDPINCALLAEVKTLLPNNNLVKPDRMGMQHALEIRSPYLDYRLAELAFKVPGGKKIENGTNKYLLKKYFANTLGRELTYRPKQMFTVPVGSWFRGKLKNLCFELLLSEKFLDRKIITRKAVLQLLEDHMNEHSNNTREIRALISLEIWFQHFIDPIS